MPERVECELLDPPVPTGGEAERSNAVWPELLLAEGPAHQAAVLRLHALMTKAARHQVSHMSPNLPAIGGVRVDDIVRQAADEATVAALGRLGSFEGRSRFTTWAYKFGILHAANEVRRNMWRHREIDLDELPDLVGGRVSPEQHVEHLDLARAVAAAIEAALTPHQRKVAIALLVDEIPIDVLAERMGSKRNALYKTLFDARCRLRSYLTTAGYLTDTVAEEMSS